MVPCLIINDPLNGICRVTVTSSIITGTGESMFSIPVLAMTAPPVCPSDLETARPRKSGAWYHEIDARKREFRHLSRARKGKT